MRSTAWLAIPILALLFSGRLPSQEEPQSPNDIERSQWPIVYQGAVINSTDFCLDVPPNVKNGQLGLALRWPRPTQFRIAIDGSISYTSNRALPQGYYSLPISPGKHILTLSVREPVDAVTIQSMISTLEAGDVPDAVAKCSPSVTPLEQSDRLHSVDDYASPRADSTPPSRTELGEGGGDSGIGPVTRSDEGAGFGGVLRVGAGVTAPVLLSRVQPEYSSAALDARIAGAVVLHAEVGPDGLAHNIRVERGLGMGLDEKAIEAVRQWRYKPAVKGHEFVTVATTIEINFRPPTRRSDSTLLPARRIPVGGALRCGLGSTWSTKEAGQNNTWIRRGTTNVFDSHNEVTGVRAVNTIVLSGSTVSVRQTRSSGGMLCIYHGSIGADGKTITGNYACPSPGYFGWEAVVDCGANDGSGAMAGSTAHRPSDAPQIIAPPDIRLPQISAPNYEDPFRKAGSKTNGTGSSGGGSSNGMGRAAPAALPIFRVPVLLSKVVPEYSERALAAGLEGTLALRITIGPDGSVQAIKPQKALGAGLDERALDAVKRWRFTPASFDGQPVSAEATVSIVFGEAQTGAAAPRDLADEGTGKLACGAGTLWEEEEAGQFRSTWVRRGMTDIFDARYRDSGTTTVNLVEVSGNTIYAQRRKSSDGYLCTYEGTPGADGRTITGTYECPPIGKRPWKASISCALSWPDSDSAEKPFLESQDKASAGIEERGPTEQPNPAAFQSPPVAVAKKTVAATIRFDAPKVLPAATSAPTLVRKFDPEYSEEARRAKHQGTVVLYIEVAPDGRAHNIQVLSPLGLGLDEKAIEAVKKWRFSPATINGLPTTIGTTIEVNFRLL